MMLDGCVPRWTAILPVKGLASAKSRLASGWGTPDELALAFLQDSLLALTGSAAVEQVVVVTSDATVADVAAQWGATIIDDSGHDGINAAASWAAEQCPEAAAVLVMVSDLPCVRAEAIDAVLGIAAEHRWSFLPDAAGTGTTMWCSTDPASVRTHFGPDSARAHAATGAVDLSQRATGTATALMDRARRDVDTPGDLVNAELLGLGPGTRAVLAAESSRR